MDVLDQWADIQNPGTGAAPVPLDSQLAELIEVVFACEAAARREDGIDAAIRYGRERKRSEHPLGWKR